MFKTMDRIQEGIEVLDSVLSIIWLDAKSKSIDINLHMIVINQLVQ